jgi:hypothetical protein
VTSRRRNAERDPRSPEAEVRDALRDVLRGGAAHSLRDLADLIAALTPDVAQRDSTELVREDRLR